MTPTDTARAVELDHDELRAAVYGLAEFRRRRAIAGQPVPAAVTALLQRLEIVYKCGVSRARHENDARAEDSKEWIGTRLAAQVLDWNARRVQRHASDLDGRVVCGRLVFPARAVHEYAKHIRSQRE